MHVPYMRVAIYTLTFLTYAYTGYGASVISTLRDAIIATEAVFSDVFQNAIHVAKKFKIVHEVFDAAVDENCVYKCPGGKYNRRTFLQSKIIILPQSKQAVNQRKTNSTRHRPTVVDLWVLVYQLNTCQ